MIVPVRLRLDRDGDADLIVGDEDGRVALVENVTPRDAKLKTPLFNMPRYFQQRADTLKCGALATPVGELTGIAMAIPILSRATQPVSSSSSKTLVQPQVVPCQVGRASARRCWGKTLFA